MPGQLKAVLFDLDDTIFDHQYARRSALGALRDFFPAIANVDVKALEANHERHLQVTHARLLDGLTTVDDSRVERVRRFCDDYGIEVSEAQLKDATALFHRVYNGARRPVPGAVPLMQELKRTVKIAVITNGMVIAQEEKIEFCGVTDLLDELIISERAGKKKPSREIFDLALSQLGVTSNEAIFVGDSWVNDVLGARGAGIPAIWFNRYEACCPEPDFSREVTELEPLDRMLRLLAE